MDTTSGEPPPDIERRDAGAVTFSEWTLPTFELRDAALDASITAWDLVPWPEGLLAHTALAADDAPTIRHHSQWTSTAACERFGRTDAPERFVAIEESPPGLVAAHFHVSTDGSRVVNYAEWTSARAHLDSLRGGTEGSVDQTGRDEWRRVRAHPALAPGSRVTRYTRHRSRSS